MASASAERQGQDVHLTSYPPAVAAVTEFSSVSPETVLTIFRRMNSDRRGASYAEQPHARPELSGTEDSISCDLDTVHVQHPDGDPLERPGLDRAQVKASELLQALDSMKGAPLSKGIAEPSQRENTSSTKVFGDGEPDDVSSANHASINNQGAETDVATPLSDIPSSTSDTQTRRSTENSVSSRPSEEATVDKRTKIKHREVQDLKEKLMTLRRENRKLKARQTCRWCRERPAALTLLPCGHYCYCERCGSSFQTCPLCGKTVLADVKTILP